MLNFVYSSILTANSTIRLLKIMRKAINRIDIVEFDGWCLFCRTASGTFKDGELRLNQSGLRLISEENGDDDVSSRSGS